MMARRRSKVLSERQKRILQVLEEFQDQAGYPPSIREICDRPNCLNYENEFWVLRGSDLLQRQSSRIERLIESRQFRTYALTLAVQRRPMHRRAAAMTCVAVGFGWRGKQ